MQFRLLTHFEGFGSLAMNLLKASHDIGISIGTTSKGTSGKTPLRKK
jgi:hypothetical protein